MTKVTVAALIIGAFIFYSVLHAQTSGAVLVPKASPGATPPAIAAVPTVTGTPPQGTATTPTPTPEATATANPTTTAPPPPTATATATTPATSAPTATTAAAAAGRYKDGSYTGAAADAQWGNIQVKAVIVQGKLTDVEFVQYPNDRSRSVRINSVADPMLANEAIQAQSAQVDIVTGATDSSEAFVQSLTDALTQART